MAFVNAIPPPLKQCLALVLAVAFCSVPGIVDEIMLQQAVQALLQVPMLLWQLQHSMRIHRVNGFSPAGME